MESYFVHFNPLALTCVTWEALMKGKIQLGEMGRRTLEFMKPISQSPHLRQSPNSRRKQDIHNMWKVGGAGTQVPNN